MYNIAIDGESPSSFPCYYLAYIYDFDFTKNSTVNGGYKSMNEINASKHALIFAKFRGSNYVCNNAYIHRTGNGIALYPTVTGTRPDGRTDYTFASSSFWNFKWYVFLPVTSSDVGGYGIATFNDHGDPVYVQSSSHDKYYAEGFKVGNVGANRLYLSTFYRIDASYNVYYYASKSDGSLVTMRMKVGSQTKSTSYNNNSPIISINAVPAAAEEALKIAGRYIVIK